MKVYSSPIKYEYDYSNFSIESLHESEETHKNSLIKYLQDLGYKGKNTGKIYSSPVGDGFASYMMAEGASSILIHLPYGDGYHDVNVKHIRKREIINRIERSEQTKEFLKTLREKVSC